MLFAGGTRPSDSFNNYADLLLDPNLKAAELNPIPRLKYGKRFATTSYCSVMMLPVTQPPKTSLVCLSLEGFIGPTWPKCFVVIKIK